MRGKRAGHIRPAEPHRRCVACRTARAQRELLRLAAVDGQVQAGKSAGRGCYLCRSEDCARKALKTGQIARALKGRAADPALDRLLAWIGSPPA